MNKNIDEFRSKDIYVGADFMESMDMQDAHARCDHAPSCDVLSDKFPKDDLYNACAYIVSQYLQYKHDPKQCDNYRQQKSVLCQHLGVDNFFARGVDPMDVNKMGKLMNDGSVAAAAAFIDGYISGFDDAGKIVKLYAEHDDSNSIYEYLRKAYSKNADLTMADMEARMLDEGPFLSYKNDSYYGEKFMDENRRVLDGCRYIAEQYALSNIDPTKCDDYDTQRNMLERLFNDDYEYLWQEDCEENDSDTMQRLIKLGDVDAGKTLLLNYVMDRDHADFVKQAFMSVDDDLSIYKYLREGLNDESITKASIEQSIREKVAKKSDSKSASANVDMLMAKANEDNEAEAIDSNDEYGDKNDENGGLG